MTVAELEQRLAALEREVGELKQKVADSPRRRNWRDSFGVFANDPLFDEIVREGRNYREQQDEDQQ